jgi:GH35 family endo-1,4-beta-xylanase
MNIYPKKQNMICYNNSIGMLVCTSLISIFYFFSQSAYAQYPGIENDIKINRQGELVIHAKPGSKITIEQISHEFWFGGAISNSFVNSNMSAENKEKYAKIFKENFNAAVTENALKWPSMEKEKGAVKYDEVDAILEWTESEGIPLRGHNLFWGITQFIQPWVLELEDEELLKTMQNRAETISTRYKGRFAEYDLNNEMIHGNYYEDRFGKDITKKMADWVIDFDPEAKLYLNDYDILTGKNLPQYMLHIRQLLDQGVPLAGIGVQGHSHSDTFDREKLRSSLDSLAIFNLPIKITEFNMPGQNSKYYKDRSLLLSQEEEEKKAKEMVDFLKICFAHPAVDGVLFWGFWEGANWIPASSMYKLDWSPTPAAEAYKDLVFKEWWTKESLTANAEGEVKVKVFYGKLKVTANGKSQEIEFSKNQNNKTINLD